MYLLFFRQQHEPVSHGAAGHCHFELELRVGVGIQQSLDRVRRRTARSAWSSEVRTGGQKDTRSRGRSFLTTHKFGSDDAKLFVLDYFFQLVCTQEPLDIIAARTETSTSGAGLSRPHHRHILLLCRGRQLGHLDPAARQPQDGLVSPRGHCDESGLRQRRRILGRRQGGGGGEGRAATAEEDISDAEPELRRRRRF